MEKNKTNNKDNPIVVKAINQIYTNINEIFGTGDDDFFIISETTVTNRKTKHTYRVLNVEHKDKTYQQWFDITNIQ
jgi:hypothetical protein